MQRQNHPGSCAALAGAGEDPCFRYRLHFESNVGAAGLQLPSASEKRHAGYPAADYIKNDSLFKKLYGNVPDDTYLSSAYYFIRAAYVEGKLGFETSASMYRKSSLDGYFYEYYKRKTTKKLKRNSM